MEDGGYADGDDIKGEEASILILRRRKRMILRRKMGTPYFLRVLVVEIYINMLK